MTTRCDASSTFGEDISFSWSIDSAKERRTERKREIQNAPLYNNNKRDRRRWHFLNINTFFRPKNVDSLCRFHVPFFFFFFSKNSLISHRFRMFAVFTHIFGESFLSLPKPPSPFLKKKKRSTIDSRRSYKVCGRLCYNVFNRCDNRRNKSKEKCTHPTPPTRYIQCVPF